MVPTALDIDASLLNKGANNPRMIQHPLEALFQFINGSDAHGFNSIGNQLILSAERTMSTVKLIFSEI
jgi:hypothetical protein